MTSTRSVKLQFSKSGILLAALAGVLIVGASGYMIIDRLFWFTDRYEAGRTGHGFFSSVNYATDGWFGIFFFGTGVAFFLQSWIAALRRLRTTTPALEVAGQRLLVHGSFSRRRMSIPLCNLESVELTTEGEAMFGTMRFLSGVAPLGSKTLVRNSGKKVCLVARFFDEQNKRRKIRLSAQFVEGGADALARFHEVLRTEQLDFANGTAIIHVDLAKSVTVE
jgi:hypothetical protein